MLMVDNVRIYMRQTMCQNQTEINTIQCRLHPMKKTYLSMVIITEWKYIFEIINITSKHRKTGVNGV